MNETETTPAEASTDEALLVHLTCRVCSPDIGICGVNLTGRPWVEDDAECVVCITMAEDQLLVCAKCGWDWRRNPEEGETR